MTQRTVLVLAVALGVAVLGSCKPPRSKQPLSDPKAAVADAKMLGVWAARGEDGEEIVLSVFPTEGAGFDVVLVGNNGKKGALVLAYTGFPSTIGGKGYWNLRGKSFGTDYGESVKVDDTYIFARYAVAGDSLTVWTMDDEQVNDAVKAGSLEGTVAEHDTLLTASSEKLAAFVASPAGDKSFKSPLAVFKRVKVELVKKPAKK